MRRILSRSLLTYKHLAEPTHKNWYWCTIDDLCGYSHTSIAMGHYNNTSEVLMKHRVQMTLTEVQFIELCVRARAVNLHLSIHDTERMAEKGITEDEAVLCLEEGYVVEMKANGRALMRLDRDKQDSICVVFALRDAAVVTCWKANANYQRRDFKPNLQPYKWNINLMSFLRQFQTT